MRIRPAIAADADAIAALITELGYPTDAAAMTRRLAAIFADPNRVTFVADGGADIVGVCGASVDCYYEKDGRYCRLLVLAVAASARGQGIGRDLVRTIERWAIDRGAREIVVNSGVRREQAHRFYERCGYARTGLRFVRVLNEVL